MHLPGARMVCHVLLVETENGLVLVDSGFGTDDIADPSGRIGLVRHIIRPVLDPAETAVRQIEKIGLTPHDVRHIILTHFDLDHIGGISDFPNAQIHITAAEAVGAFTTPVQLERQRYRPSQWSYGPKIVEHDPNGEKWRGFAAAKELTDIAPGIVLVSLPGHTRGHACVAVDAGHRWILHAGDSFYHPGSIGESTKVPAALRIQERLVAFDIKRVRENHARLTELHNRPEADLTLVNAHDPTLLERARATM